MRLTFAVIAGLICSNGARDGVLLLTRVVVGDTGKALLFEAKIFSHDKQVHGGSNIFSIEFFMNPDKNRYTKDIEQTISHSSKCGTLF